MKAVAVLATTVALCATLAGCATRYVGTPAVNAQCEAVCYVDDGKDDETACASRATWDGDPKDPAAIDALIYGTVPALRKETWTCGIRLKACQQCIDRLVNAGVIVKP